MTNSFFQFKEFRVHQDRCSMKVTTDACLFGGWMENEVRSRKYEVCNVLDIGTGSGLLPLMFAQKNPNAKIDAIEIDKETYGQAKENINDSSWKDSVNIVYGDARNYPFPTQYDLIFSNPPFYEKEFKSDNKKRNIALHNEGLLLDELLDIIKRTLKQDGRFYLLLPYKRNNEIEKLVSQKKLAINHKIFVRQSTNHDYFRIMITGMHQQANETECSTTEISIWNDQQQYTKDFTELLKDYYLHL